MDPRPSIIPRVEALKSKNAMLVIFKILTQDHPECYSRNANGVFFNLAKISDGAITKLLQVLDQLESHQSEYDNTAKELELLKRVLATKEPTPLERELPHPSEEARATRGTAVPVRRRPPGAVTAKEDNDYDAMMKAHLKPPVYKGVLGRLDKLVRKQRRRRSFHRKSPRWSDHLQPTAGDPEDAEDPEDDPECDFEDPEGDPEDPEGDPVEDPEDDPAEDPEGDQEDDPDGDLEGDLEGDLDPDGEPEESDSEDCSETDPSEEGDSEQESLDPDELRAEERKKKLQSFLGLGASSSSLATAFPLMTPEDDFDDMH